ncbi:ovostatin-like [Spea bombifrons]|uniref:ovostatin-like n=1 Tax=Spea bombifrons TaxID=233779 RepID=UPI002349913C|nr:ovostatin-like [Spea bombifrons]
MSRSQLLLSVTLLSLIAGGIAEPQYALSIPALLKSEQNATACVNFVRMNETVALEVVMGVFNENYTIFNEQIPTGDTFKCSPFQVPRLKSAAPVFVTLVAAGQTLRFDERRSVVIDVMGDIHVVNLDKPIYKAGDLVRGQIIALDNRLQPVEENYTAVHVLDPSGNRMHQWLNLGSVRGIASFQFSLLSDAEVGSYRIEAQWGSTDRAAQSFTVEEYVPPKFRMSVESPSTITVLDQTMTFNISVMYMYGQGVPGALSGRVCRQYSSYSYAGNPCYRDPDGICVSVTGQLGPDGVFNGTTDLSPFQLDRSGLAMTLRLQFTLTEEGTGVQLTETKNVFISRQVARVAFDRDAMLPFYKRGIPYRVRMNLLSADDRPIANETVELLLNGQNVYNGTSAQDGGVEHEIDTAELLQPDFQIQAVYRNQDQCNDNNWVTPTYTGDFYSVRRFYSRTGSFIQVRGSRAELACGGNHNVRVQYSFSRQGVESSNGRLSVYYLVLSRAQIVQNGAHSLDVSSSLRGEFNLSFSVSADLAPAVDVAVYSILDTEVVGDTVKLDVEKCFKNNVSISFSVDEAIPGSNVTLEVSAAPRSLCGLRVVDSSLLLLNQREYLTPESVYNSLRYNSLGGYYFAGYNVAPPSPPCIDPNQQIFVNGLYYQPISYFGEGDTSQAFSRVGLVFASNASIYKPEVCGGGNFRPGPVGPFSTVAFAREDVFVSSAGASVSADVITTERVNFPGVWHFSLSEVGDDGSASVPEVVPGTITQWKGTGFCVSEEAGFGMTTRSSSASFTSSLPFFADITLPYSIVREESFLLRGFVSNYLPQCIRTRVELASSEEFTAELQEGNQDTCTCTGQRASYSWRINASAIGVISINLTAWTTSIGDTCDSSNDPTQSPRRDTVVQTLIVEAEGIENEITFSRLVNVQGRNVQIPVRITPPNNVVPGSVRSNVIVIGEPMGLAVNFLESLIRLPTGCGEQNLAMLMPIPAVLNYLNQTNQLTDETLARATRYMEIGYIRQLQYIRPDGLSRVFGSGNSPTSTWLTAKMFWTFEQIKPYVFVDDGIQNRALQVIERSQDRNTGCFKPQGMIFNSALTGGAEDDVSFTGFVVAMLLQSNYPGGQTLLRGAIGCLEAASRTNQSLYNRALMFYAFRVLGNEERSNALFQQLQQEAVVDDGSIHWERAEKPNPSPTPFFDSPSASAEIEITGTVLLALTHRRSPLTHRPAPSDADKSYIAQISLWLARQLNSRGGFRSTADTAVAVQALGAFGSLVFTENATHRVQVSSGNQAVATFNVTRSNRLLLQTQPLEDGAGDYTIDVRGTGSVLVQVATRYNVPVSEEDSAFALSVNTSDSCVNGVAYSFTVTVGVSYHGSRNRSNMAIVDVKMLSGYTPERSSLVQLRTTVSKVEERNNHLILYLSSVSNQTVYLSFNLEMQSRVLNFQPQSVNAYDYYETDENGIATLRHPCSA